MRIRTYRPGDIPILAHIQQQAARADGLELMSEADFTQWVIRPELQIGHHIFLATDDDDELNTWGQGETLEGVEGEAAGYTILELRREADAYHFFCQGTVLPKYRRQGVGYALI